MGTVTALILTLRLDLLDANHTHMPSYTQVQEMDEDSPIKNSEHSRPFQGIDFDAAKEQITGGPGDRRSMGSDDAASSAAGVLMLLTIGSEVTAMHEHRHKSACTNCIGHTNMHTRSTAGGQAQGRGNGCRALGTSHEHTVQRFRRLQIHQDQPGALCDQAAPVHAALQVRTCMHVRT